MTDREFLNAIIAANVTEELTAEAQKRVERLDHTNEVRRNAAAKKAAERDKERAPMIEALKGALTKEFKTAPTLIAETGLEIKPAMVATIMKPFIADGTVIKEEIKDGKDKHMGYALAE